MTTHIFNLVRLKDLASKDPTISPDISVWEKMVSTLLVKNDVKPSH